MGDLARHLHVANFLGFIVGPIIALLLFRLNKPWAKWVSIAMLMGIVHPPGQPVEVLIRQSLRYARSFAPQNRPVAWF